MSLVLLRLLVRTLLSMLTLGGAPAVYHVAVSGTGADGVRLVRFDGTSLALERAIRVTTDDSTAVDGIAAAPGGALIYATAGRGTPDGRLYKLDAIKGALVASSSVLSPGVSEIAISGDGALAFVTMNDPQKMLAPGSTWVISTSDMKPVASLGTCMMQLAGKLALKDTRHYSVCGMEDQVIEVDAAARRILRRFSVAEDAEGGVDTLAAKPEGPYMEGRVLPPSCSPTDVQVSARADRLWVTCNRNATVLEIAADKWTLVRKLEVGHGPYALAVTPDGKQLIVVLRQGAALQFFDAGSGKERAQTPTSAAAPVGIALSAD